ncbi:MAG TPA: diguanylate cyclase [Steroidobacteraceae bacterium]
MKAVSSPRSRTTAGQQPGGTSMELLQDCAQRCRVLLVDDDQLALRRFAALFRSAGYDVFTATSGLEALNTLDRELCHIVLTDWQMPNMDGLTLCRNIRMRDPTGYVYVLMLTVRSSKRDLLAGLAAGADDYVIKDAAAEEILARLQVGRRITYLERALRKSNVENLRMSLMDSLTGARNRRFLMKYLPSELKRSRRYRHPLTVLSCDIDHFKRINDNFGHHAGDEVLQSFVARAESCLRQSVDWIARAGGEEFVLVLPETPLMGGCHAAERLRESLAAQTIITSSGPLTITVSIGVAALETSAELDNTSARELLSTADRCLYTSKRLGRNRVTAAAAQRAEGAPEVSESPR